jgi:hypothetical protein
MPDVFGGSTPEPDKKKKPASRGEPDMLYGSMDPRAGEGPRGRYVQYDNESGEIMVNLPAKFGRFKRELEEDLMEEFYGEPTGAAEGGKSIDTWIQAWIDKKVEEDPSLGGPDAEDAP